MIRASEIRGQLTQIDKFRAAVNTFRDKYNCLPGDCQNAANFGFVARGTLAGQGNGDSVIEGHNGGIAQGYAEGYGETVLFWRDLSASGLIEGSFTSATATVNPGTITKTSTPNLNDYFPTAKIGNGNYVYVWSGGINSNDRQNYFGVAAIDFISAGWNVQGISWGRPESIPVIDAYQIDRKIDDGFPVTGKVTIIELYGGPVYATLTTGVGGPMNCSDRPSGSGPQLYALDINNRAGRNCSLSFLF